MIRDEADPRLYPRDLNIHVLGLRYNYLQLLMSTSRRMPYRRYRSNFRYDILVFFDLGDLGTMGTVR